MKLLNIRKLSEEENREGHNRPNGTEIPAVENNVDGGVRAQNNPPDDRMRETDEDEPFNIIKYYHGREWSEVEHLLKLPPESEKDEDEEDIDWSPAPSQMSTDSQDDPFAEDIHDLVNVLDNMIRSQSNLSCDAIRVVDYLDLDLIKHENMITEIQNWSWDSDDLISDESVGSSE